MKNLFEQFKDKAQWLKDSKAEDFDGDHTKGQFYERKCFVPRDKSPVNFLIGRNSYFQYSEMLPNNVLIGRYCSINTSAIIGAESHQMDELTTGIKNMDEIPEELSPANELDHLTILGCDVWVGAKAVILGGLTIGHGACIGAGAIVTKDVAPYSIVVGCPARHLRYRFAESLRADLLKSRWWELDRETVNQLPDDPHKAVEICKSMKQNGRNR